MCLGSSQNRAQPAGGYGLHSTCVPVRCVQATERAPSCLLACLMRACMRPSTKIARSVAAAPHLPLYQTREACTRLRCVPPSTPMHTHTHTNTHTHTCMMSASWPSSSPNAMTTPKSKKNTSCASGRVSWCVGEEWALATQLHELKGGGGAAPLQLQLRARAPHP